MKNKQLISKNIDTFYTRASEETRLEKGMGVFEFERIKYLIKKYILKSSPIRILDIGGGTGKYAEWLAEQGHQVCLIDPVIKHVNIAKNRSAALKNKFSVHLGEARKLDFPNNFADLVILHGPLYHLQKREDRCLAIKEAKRVLKNDGIILGFAINSTASTIVGLLQGWIHKDSFFEMCKKELTTGAHHPPYDFPWLLAQAYYHRPDELKKEFACQGLTNLNIYAVEGMSWLDGNFFSNMRHKQNKQTLMQLLTMTENDEYLLPFSPHIMIAAQKQDNNEQ